jgi:hypothetical protein
VFDIPLASSQSNQQEEIMSALVNMPLPARCALETFGLLDHYFRVYGMDADPDRIQLDDAAFAYAQRQYHLGEAEGF